MCSYISRKGAFSYATRREIRVQTALASSVSQPWVASAEPWALVDRFKG